MEDAGTYSVNIDGKISTFILRVYRELTEPTVTCESLNCSGSICLFSLHCSCLPDTGFGNVSYTWRGWDQQWEERPVVLTVVDKSSLDNLGPLTCTARNAVSSRSVTVTTPEGLCPGPAGVHKSLSQTMRDFWIQLLALLTLLHQTASDTTELIRVVGRTVTFQSPSTDTKPALWSFGYDPIVTVLFEDPPRPIFLKEKYKTRFTVSDDGQALSISQLRMEDAGTYSVTIDEKIFTFILRVYKELTKPIVTCETQDCSGGNCVVSLHCSVPGAGFGNVSYSWTGWDRQWDEGSMVQTVVDKSSWGNLGLLRCTAQNAISSQSVTVTIPERLCRDTSSRSRVVIIVLAGIGAAVGVLLVFLIFFCKSKDTSSRSRVVIMVLAGIGAAVGVLLVFLIFFCKSKGRQAARLRFLPLLGHWDCPDTARWPLTITRTGHRPALTITGTGHGPALTITRTGHRPALTITRTGHRPALTITGTGHGPALTITGTDHVSP
ncbi:hypothetical protein HGM15179_020705 [Zosterops borbonicus]|uniref:Ig-like domain-containing protein n=1 Tax=Zosterops borbonicus TaxID=364589 RepID=A0A8K1D797_9PASS|nr:hypothetical protein HGM15179_020705 [Zosterops borbonicus]